MTRAALAWLVCARVVIAQTCDPDVLSSLAMPDQEAARQLVVLDGLIYVANRHQGLVIADVREPASPTLLSVLPLGPLVQGVDVADSPAGALALVTMRTAGIAIIDVDDPTAPVVVSTLGGFQGSTEQVRIVWPFAYVSTVGVGQLAGGLNVIDISDPAAPVVVAFDETQGHPQGLVARGNRLYVAAATQGLLVYDVGDPAHPALLGVAPTNGVAWDVDVVGDVAVVANGAPGLCLVDVSDPHLPFVVASVNTPGEARGVFASGALAYLVERDALLGTGALRIFDISTPDAPAQVEAVPAATLAHAVVVSGPVAYVAEGEQTPPIGLIEVIDVSSCQGCRADVNQDGALSVLDFVAFQQAFVAGDASADCDGDGGAERL